MAKEGILQLGSLIEADDDHNEDNDEDDDNEDDDEDGNDKIKYQREGFSTFTGVTSTVCNSCSYV